MDTNLTEFLGTVVQETGVPGAAGIVVSHEGLVDQAAAGVRRLGRATPVTIDDKFHIGSNSKAWTATACAAVVNQGLIAWDTRIHDVFADAAGRLQPGYGSVTLEMLLRHMAGVLPYTEEEHLEDLPELPDSPREARLAFARWLLREKGPINEPGTEVSYSNAGYTLAAAMIEAATGRSWEALIQAHICRPLGIEASGGWPASADPEQPWGHRIEEGVVTPHPPDDDFTLPAIIAPAGDLQLSMPDYGRFLQMNLKALQGEETILPVDLLQHLHNQGQPGVGLGWGVQSLGDLGLASVHSGSAGTFLCLAAVSHARDRALALAVNAGSEADQSVEQATAAGFKELVASCLTASPKNQ